MRTRSLTRKPKKKISLADWMKTLTFRPFFFSDSDCEKTVKRQSWLFRGLRKTHFVVTETLPDWRLTVLLGGISFWFWQPVGRLWRVRMRAGVAGSWIRHSLPIRTDKWAAPKVFVARSSWEKGAVVEWDGSKPGGTPWRHYRPLYKSWSECTTTRVKS